MSNQNKLILIYAGILCCISSIIASVIAFSMNYDEKVLFPIALPTVFLSLLIRKLIDLKKGNN
jgi:hypothetical protein